jgi:hypothetical protein
MSGVMTETQSNQRLQRTARNMRLLKRAVMTSKIIQKTDARNWKTQIHLVRQPVPAGFVGR